MLDGVNIEFNFINSESQIFKKKKKSTNFYETANEYQITVDRQDRVFFTYLHIQYQHGGRTHRVLVSPTHATLTVRYCKYTSNNTRPFLRALQKLRKATISLVMFVRLSVFMEQLGFHGTDFHES